MDPDELLARADANRARDATEAARREAEARGQRAQDKERFVDFVRGFRAIAEARGLKPRPIGTTESRVSRRTPWEFTVGANPKRTVHYLPLGDGWVIDEVDSSDAAWNSRHVVILFDDDRLLWGDGSTYIGKDGGGRQADWPGRTPVLIGNYGNPWRPSDGDFVSSLSVAKMQELEELTVALFARLR